MPVLQGKLNRQYFQIESEGVYRLSKLELAGIRFVRFGKHLLARIKLIKLLANKNVSQTLLDYLVNF